MTIWAIADLHLSFGVPNKKMDVFGERWHNHAERLQKNWHALVSNEDLVLVPGDISWAKLPQEAVPDLAWIHALPGTKLLLQGNHDYWWSSLSKVKAMLPPSIHVLQQDVFNWNEVSIGGARLWDTPEFSWDEWIKETPPPKGQVKLAASPVTDDQKVFNRELMRLETSLRQLNPQAKTRIALTHYPPIGPQLGPTQTSALLEKYGVNLCLFGHVHSVIPESFPIRAARGVTYALTACDYLNCIPLDLTRYVGESSL